MFNLFKKEEPIKEVEATQSGDWTREIKRNQLIGKEAEQMSFEYHSSNDLLDKGTKMGLSSDHLKILKKCKDESSAIELMKILKRTNKSKFKNVIIKPLIENGFLELTIPEKPKSPNQKYRLTNLFVRRRIKT
ncbi:MAG: hypothetical protein NZ775_02715 [Gammaproteobacteria bacterium]|nr:hypothetical protein [Gammaproteobacteria bacterium]